MFTEQTVSQAGITYTAIDTRSTSGSLLPMYRAASCGWHLWLALPHHGQLTSHTFSPSIDVQEEQRQSHMHVVCYGIGVRCVEGIDIRSKTSYLSANVKAKQSVSGTL